MKPATIGLLTVVVGALALTGCSSDPEPAPTLPAPTSTAAAAADNPEQDIVDACHQSIISRGASDPMIGAGADLTWESSETSKTALGQYDVKGTLAAADLGTTWRYEYTCTVVAVQGGDGSGRWVATDQGFTRVF